MKKYLKMLICSLSIFVVPNMVVLAAGCSPTIQPNGQCLETGYFGDPSMSDIINNNCTNYITKKTNEYCKTYCREDVQTKFPKLSTTLSVDQYDAILGGNHFRWDNFYVTSTKECTTVIDYDKWARDFEVIKKDYEWAAKRAVGEFHQRDTDHDTKRACQGNTIIGYETEIQYFPYLMSEPPLTVSNAEKCYQKHSQATFVSGLCYYCTSGYLMERKGGEGTGRCYKRVSVPIYKKGTIHTYERVEYDTWGNPTVVRSQTYCSANGKPYHDDDIDKYWTNQYNTAKAKYDRIISQLRVCNNSVGFSYDSNIGMVVNYKDPASVYSRTVTLNKTKVSSSTTSAQGDINGAVSGSNCSLSNSLFNVCPPTSIPGLVNRKVYQKSTVQYLYKMPTGIYQYILKTDGKAVDANSTEGKNEVSSGKNRYIDIGYSNYPVHYTTKTGTYPISMTYTNVGENGKFGKNLEYSCEYKVINRIIPCTGKDCENPECIGDSCDRCYGANCDNGGNGGGGGGNTDLGGINVIYRPISLVNPFPGTSGTGRTAGENWSQSDIANYITNNRNTKQNDVYNQTPLYSFTLDPKAIRQIKTYNKSKDPDTGKVRDYNDFNLTCSKKYGKRCLSTFLKNIRNYGVTVNKSTCWGANASNFYSCADKPDQDNIKCYLNKQKKLVCVDCIKNADNAVCKTETE